MCFALSISISTRKSYKRSTRLWVFLRLSLPPPQSCSSPLQYCLASVVSLHVLSSDVVGESSNSETLFRKTNKPLMDWKLMEVAYWPRVDHFLLISIEISTIRTRTNSSRKIFPVSSCVLTNIHISTASTLHFLVFIQQRHLRNGRNVIIKMKKLILGSDQSERFEIFVQWFILIWTFEKRKIFFQVIIQCIEHLFLA